MLFIACLVWAGSNLVCSSDYIYDKLSDRQYYIAYVIFEFLTYYLLVVGMVLIVLLAKALHKLMSVSKGLEGHDLKVLYLQLLMTVLLFGT
jgi:hypothetical protein